MRSALWEWRIYDNSLKNSRLTIALQQLLSSRIIIDSFSRYFLQVVKASLADARVNIIFR